MTVSEYKVKPFLSPSVLTGASIRLLDVLLELGSLLLDGGEHLLLDLVRRGLALLQALEQLQLRPQRGDRLVHEVGDGDRERVQLAPRAVGHLAPVIPLQGKEKR